MTTKIIFLITLVSYSIIVSPPFSYIIALKNVQLSLEAPTVKLRTSLVV